MHARHDGRQITANARAGFRQPFLKQVDAASPELPESERQRRADHLLKAHMQRLALASSRARARKAAMMTVAANGSQWAKVPESVAYADLDATAMRVLIILAAKAGQDRTAWVAQQTVADRLGVGRTTVGMAIGRLEKPRPEGRLGCGRSRTRNLGPEVQSGPYLPVVTPRVDIGSQGEASDVNGEAPDVNAVLPDVNLEGPDVADQARLATHSVPIDQSLSISPSVSAEAVGEEKQERPQDRAEETKQEPPAFDAQQWMAQRERRLGVEGVSSSRIQSRTPEPVPVPAKRG